MTRRVSCVLCTAGADKRDSPKRSLRLARDGPPKPTFRPKRKPVVRAASPARVRLA